MRLWPDRGPRWYTIPHLHDGAAALRAPWVEWTDIFLADLKLVSPSPADGIFKSGEIIPGTAQKAIDAMKRMQPKDEFASDGIMQKRR